jgi:hypothetical protein
MILRTVTGLLCAASLAACAGLASQPTSSPTREETSMESPAPSSSHPIELSSQQPSLVPGEEVTLTGVLGADAVEGGCGYLEAPDGVRFEIIYPAGWDLQLSPLQLTSPAGDVVARGGDEVTVRGEETSEMASICQIGPIFRAREVVVLP